MAGAAGALIFAVREENAKTVKRLVLWLALALGSLVLETAGLALAAALT